METQESVSTGYESETVLTDKDREQITAWLEASHEQGHRLGAIEALQTVRNYCIDHIVKFADETAPGTFSVIRTFKAVIELSEGLSEYYEKPEQAARVIKRIKSKRNQKHKEPLKLAA